MPPLCSIVVLDQQKIMGLIMSHHLDRLLGTRYGVSLYNLPVPYFPKCYLSSESILRFVQKTFAKGHINLAKTKKA